MARPHFNEEPMDEGMDGGEGRVPNMAGKRVFFRRKKSCPLQDYAIADINYKDIKLLSRFISERGRILPSRITSVSAKKQRALKNAIKQARILALLPFVAS
ncbi:MAG: rpsR [Rickettsiales bacterium]|jgi:small subunit ribosomal protein S18|nr:rpsR [Rickettsiales bacterium]